MPRKHKDARRDAVRIANTLLTHAQHEVFEYLLFGYTTQEIADDTDRSAYTISNHIRKVFEAFEVRSRGELLALFVVAPPVWRATRLRFEKGWFARQ